MLRQGLDRVLMGVPVVLPCLPAGHDLLNIGAGVRHRDAQILADGPRVLPYADCLRHPLKGVPLLLGNKRNHGLPRGGTRLGHGLNIERLARSEGQPHERQAHFLGNSLHVLIFRPISAFPTLEFSARDAKERNECFLCRL